MQLWAVLVAATLLAVCGAEAPPPEPTPTPTPTPSRGPFWGFVALMGQAAENASARLWGSPMGQRVGALLSELRSQALAVGAGLRREGAELRERASAYGAGLSQEGAELRSRAALLARRLRRRLARDGDELRMRLAGYGHAAAQGARRLRELLGFGPKNDEIGQIGESGEMGEAGAD